MNMTSLFGRSKPAPPPPEKKASSAVKAYQEAEFIFTKRIEHLERKIAKTSGEAAEAYGFGRKAAAITHLRRRRLYQSHVDHLVKMLMILESQRIYLESGTLDVEVMTALKTGSTELKSIIQHMEPRKVDELVDEIKDLFTQNDSMSRRLAEAFDDIGRGGGAGSSDESILEEELNALAQEQQQQQQHLPAAAAAASSSSSIESLLARLPSVPPTTPARQRSAVKLLAS